MDFVVSSGRNRAKKLNRDDRRSRGRHVRVRVLAIPAIAAALALGWFAGRCAVVAHAQSARTIWSGIYSEAQARRGEEADKLECAWTATSRI